MLVKILASFSSCTEFLSSINLYLFILNNGPCIHADGYVEIYQTKLDALLKCFQSYEQSVDIHSFSTFLLDEDRWSSFVGVFHNS